jgi:hypothetical protein
LKKKLTKGHKKLKEQEPNYKRIHYKLGLKDKIENHKFFDKKAKKKNRN